MHGGLDSNRECTPAIGQKQIHQKIQQLNFRDCHAKISQVDSQLTLENGVVVQVSTLCTRNDIIEINMHWDIEYFIFKALLFFITQYSAIRFLYDIYACFNLFKVTHFYKII